MCGDLDEVLHVVILLDHSINLNCQATVLSLFLSIYCPYLLIVFQVHDGSKAGAKKVNHNNHPEGSGVLRF